MDEFEPTSAAPLPNGVAHDIAAFQADPIEERKPKAKRKQRKRKQRSDKGKPRKVRAAAPVEQSLTVSASPPERVVPVEEAPAPFVAAKPSAGAPSFRKPDPQPDFITYATWAAIAVLTLGAAAGFIWGV